MLDKYFDDVRKYPLLTSEQEIELAEQIKAGNLKARNDMVRANLRLVVKIAMRYRGKGMPFWDLVGHGNHGLIHAANTYDGNRDVRFGTYATEWIKYHIRQHIDRYATKAIRVPWHTGRQIAGMLSAKDDLIKELGREPTDQELASKLGIKLRPLRTLISAHLVSFTMTLDRPNQEATGDAQTDHKYLIPDHRGQEEDIELSGMIKDALKHLPARSRDIISLRFGFTDGSSRTLDEVGKQYGLSGERVRQIEARSLHKLREVLAKIEKDYQ